MPSDPTNELRERIENTIRFLAVDAVQRANSGHPGAPMGLARPAFELWDRYLRFDPSDPDWPLRDRFVLSNGHASMLQYALLHLFGFGLSLDDIRAFRQLGSRTPGHPEYGETPGVELTTGPLGQGFGHGVGMALAARMTRARYASGDAGPGHHFVYGIVSDGDLMEGISHEAGSLAGHLGLGNLIYLFDANRITIDGPTRLSFSEDVPARFAAQRWHVQEVDGEDVAGIRAALEAARAETERPSLIVTRTTIGRGSPNRAGKSKAHGEALGEEEVRLTKQAAGWPLEPELLVPDDVRAWFARRAEEKRAERRASDEALERWRRERPERAAAWDAARGRVLPSGLRASLLEGLEGKDDATRKHSAAVLERLAGAAPYLVGGSADLAGSAAPPILKGRGHVGPAADEGEDPYAGSNIHFGVREHAMAAISNGIALDGTLQPYCGTFLIFSDYCRPSLRLAALMKLRTVFVFTHDSIFLGEDGPTHEPIEHLDSLRVMPNLTLFRPADGVETALAWEWIMTRARGPVALALSRQKVRAVKRDGSFSPEDVWRGAYVLSGGDAEPRLVLVASGSELPLACDAAEQLRADDVAVRVVSAPSLDLFFEQPPAYRRGVVPEEGALVVAVEASRAESYRRLVGREGLVLGVDRFGASAPHTALAEEYGFTPDRVVQRVRERLGR